MDSIKSHNPDEYLTILRTADTETIERRSRFLAAARQVASQEAAAFLLDEMRKKHHDATHHCSAWRIGADRKLFRFSDDGEPAGSAGRRILAAIDRHGLTDVAVIVVRRFGGIKLGTGGLAGAYSNAAELVLAKAGTERKWLMDKYHVAFPWEMSSQAHAVLDKFAARVLSREYADRPAYLVELRRSFSGGFLAELTEATGGCAKIDPAP